MDFMESDRRVNGLVADWQADTMCDHSVFSEWEGMLAFPSYRTQSRDSRVENLNANDSAPTEVEYFLVLKTAILVVFELSLECLNDLLTSWQTNRWLVHWLYPAGTLTEFEMQTALWSILISEAAETLLETVCSRSSTEDSTENSAGDFQLESLTEMVMHRHLTSPDASTLCCRWHRRLRSFSDVNLIDWILFTRLCLLG